MCGCSGGASDGAANNASLVSLIHLGKRRVLTLKLSRVATRRSRGEFGRAIVKDLFILAI